MGRVPFSCAVGDSSQPRSAATTERADPLFPRGDATTNRHGRARPGHPRFRGGGFVAAALWRRLCGGGTPLRQQNVDGRIKSGHDDRNGLRRQVAAASSAARLAARFFSIMLTEMIEAS
jgi:hypothetical protein